jgi:hypothetical protein
MPFVGLLRAVLGPLDVRGGTFLNRALSGFKDFYFGFVANSIN